MEFPKSTLELMTDAILLSPLFLGVGCSLALFLRKDSPWIIRWMGRISFIVSGLLFLLSVLMTLAPSDLYPLAFSLMRVDIHIDALSLYFILIINMIAFIASWNTISYLGEKSPEERIQRPTFFHSMFNLFHFTMLLVPMVDNLIVLWIAIELTTLSSTFLVGFRNKPASWEAAWKYLIVTSTGIILALLGTMFLANALPKGLIPTGPSGEPLNTIMNWTFLMEVASQLSPDFVKLSFLFILLGYGTKAGFAPLHTWLPDGHGEAPAPISALLSGVLLKAALYAILRFYTITNIAVPNGLIFTSTILLGSGLFSLMVAVPFILKKNRFKRVLAYSSLEHMGIITLGIGLGGPVALFGALLHIFNHAIIKTLMFLSYGNVLRQYEKSALESEEFSENKITGVLRSMPITGTILTLGGLALAGTPPFNIFLSELIILWGALSRFWFPSNLAPAFPDWAIVTTVGIFALSTTLIFYGLIRHLAKRVLHKMPNEHRLEEALWGDMLPLFTLLGLVTLMGLWIIPLLANLINGSVNILLQIGN
jgi:hydrogenase-4 component F